MCPWKRPQSSAQRMSKLCDAGRVDVGDVVDSGVGVGLHPELARPERVDDVERGDMELHVLVDGQLQARRLHAAEGRVAVGPVPLLADHLHLELRSPGRLRDRARPLPAAGSGPARTGAPCRRRPRTRRSPRWRRSRSPGCGCRPGSRRPRRAPSRDGERRSARRRSRRRSARRSGSRCRAGRCCRRPGSRPRWSPCPGGSPGAATRTTIGVATTLSASQRIMMRRKWRGSDIRGPSSDHVEEAVHVADRLHRSREPVDEAGRAGNEALPADTARASRCGS